MLTDHIVPGRSVCIGEMQYRGIVGWISSGRGHFSLPDVSGSGMGQDHFACHVAWCSMKSCKSGTAFFSSEHVTGIRPRNSPVGICMDRGSFEGPTVHSVLGNRYFLRTGLSHMIMMSISQ
jgi:hypothetical protein